MVVRECFNGDKESQWKRPKFHPSPHQNEQNPLTDCHQRPKMIVTADLTAEAEMMIFLPLCTKKLRKHGKYFQVEELLPCNRKSWLLDLSLK